MLMVAGAPGQDARAGTPPGKAASSAASDASRSKANKAGKRRSRRANKRRGKRVKKTKVCRRRKGKRRCRWIAEFQGKGVSKSSLRTEPLPRPSGDLWVYAVNFREELRVNLYDDRGDFDDEALARLDHAFRCKRTGDIRAVNPRLYEILSIIYDHFGGKRIEIISGFRNQRKETSRHYHASAMDIRVTGVPIDELYEFAGTLDMGNMGIGRYPNSQFVHVDFRAPGAASFRWVDYSRSGSSGKKRSKRRKKRPNS